MFGAAPATVGVPLKRDRARHASANPQGYHQPPAGCQLGEPPLAAFGEKWEARYPAIIRLWENAWAEFVPFLQFDKEIRTVVCTTNAIVILSPLACVVHVGHEEVRAGRLRAGRAYLPPSITRIFRRSNACSAGRFTRLAAGVVDRSGR
ncbi:hypothetical protein GCM10027360_17590 [Amycolatopsis echigonensis]|nr:hypothetical protein GCM10017788_18800 [Amycolatopsis acidiphila]